MHGALCGANPAARASLQRPRGAGFWLCDILLCVGAVQSKFNHPSLLNGREILSSGRGAKFKI